MSSSHTRSLFTVALLALAFLGLAALVLGPSGASAPVVAAEKMPVPEDAAVAYFASGCFWCVEAIYESVEGVFEAVSGYAGGQQENPTYEQVGRGQTDHAEAVKVYYDPEVVSYATLVDVFFGSHNVTQVNGQGPDLGKQYRSVLFYANDDEKAIAEKKKADLAASGKYDQPIAAEIQLIEKFWRAEEYHQDYERLNPNNPYVRNVSIPRLKKFQAKFPELLKKAHS